MSFDQDPRDEIQPTKEEWEAAMGKDPITTAQLREAADIADAQIPWSNIYGLLRAAADQLDAARAELAEQIGHRKYDLSLHHADVAEIKRLRAQVAALEKERDSARAELADAAKVQE